MSKSVYLQPVQISQILATEPDLAKNPDIPLVGLSIKLLGLPIQAHIVINSGPGEEGQTEGFFNAVIKPRIIQRLNELNEDLHVIGVLYFRDEGDPQEGEKIGETIQ